MDISNQDLKKIGYVQKTMIITVLLRLICIFLFFIPVVPVILDIILAVIMIGSVWKLTHLLGGGAGKAIMLCLLLFVPFIYWIVFFYLNNGASFALRQAGVPTGFLGASRSDLEKL